MGALSLLGMTFVVAKSGSFPCILFAMNEPTSPPGRPVLPIISAVTFLSFLDTPLLIPIMALYATGLGASVSISGLIIGIFSIVGTPASIYFGRLVDRFGYKIPLIAGLIGDAIALFLYTLCQSPLQLILVRALHGASSAVAGPATMSVMADYAARTTKGKVMAFYGISIATANLVGSGLSGVMASRLGYAAVFLIGSGLMLVTIILVLLLPGSRHKSDAIPRTSLGENLRQVKKLLVRRGLTMSYAAIFAQYFAFGGIATLLPLYLKGYGMTAFHFGMLLAIFTLLFIVIQYPSGKLSDRVGRVAPTIAGLSLAIVSLAMLPFVSTFLLLAIVMAVYGLGYGLFFPSISASVADHAPPGQRGIATGIFYAALVGGVAIGAPLMGWAGEVMGIQPALMFAPAFMALALVIAVTNLKRKEMV